MSSLGAHRAVVSEINAFLCAFFSCVCSLIQHVITSGWRDSSVFPRPGDLLPTALALQADSAGLELGDPVLCL